MIKHKMGRQAYIYELRGGVTLSAFRSRFTGIYQVKEYHDGIEFSTHYFTTWKKTKRYIKKRSRELI